MIYTVDEVSDLLSIPRPTLYRYLREYSIPHVRRSGKISIPEESFDRIKEARELHREGLGTVSVRRRLRKVSDPVDAEELTERLDRLSGTLESLREAPGPTGGGSSPSRETLQTVLKKQDFLISAVSNLTEMVENLLSKDVRPRKVDFGDADERTRGEFVFEQPGGSLVTIERDVETDVETDDPVTEDLSEAVEYSTAPTGREKFGTLARRRRRGILVVLLVTLLASTALAWGPLDLGGRAFEQPASEEQSSVEEDFQSVPATDEEVPQAPRTVEVPDLVGMALPEAEDKLTAAGLKLGAWNEIPTYEFAAGRVVTQGSQAGEEVDQDSPVDLIVSVAPSVSQPETPVSNIGGPSVDQYPGGVFQPVNQGVIPPAPF